jgi:hypothetical protein
MEGSSLQCRKRIHQWFELISIRAEMYYSIYVHQNYSKIFGNTYSKFRCIQKSLAQGSIQIIRDILGGRQHVTLPSFKTTVVNALGSGKSCVTAILGI